MVEQVFFNNISFLFSYPPVYIEMLILLLSAPQVQRKTDVQQVLPKKFSIYIYLKPTFIKEVLKTHALSVDKQRTELVIIIFNCVYFEILTPKSLSQKHIFVQISLVIYMLDCRLYQPSQVSLGQTCIYYAYIVSQCIVLIQECTVICLCWWTQSGKILIRRTISVYDRYTISTKFFIYLILFDSHANINFEFHL